MEGRRCAIFSRGTLTGGRVALATLREEGAKKSLPEFCLLVLAYWVFSWVLLVDHLTSSKFSETNDTDIDLPDVDRHTPFARRLVLDDSVQLLEHILLALENEYDNSRSPNSSVPGVVPAS